MENFNLFLNEIKRLEINAIEYRYLEGAGWVKASDYPQLPKNLKKSFWWELTAIDERKLKELQSNAVNDIMLLKTKKLQRCLKRLDIIKSFSAFYDFIKKFYVKFLENKYDGRDVTDFKLELEGCFTVNVPEKGNFDIHFLGELQDQVFYKHALLDGLKYQIEQLLPKQSQSKTKRTGKKHPKLTYDQLFKEPKKADLALEQFKKTFPGILSDDNSYIGKGKKGYFPLFIEVLEKLSYINKQSDITRKNALNSKIKNLNLSKDASEFRKQYRLITDDNRTDLKLSLEHI
ncbi:hypothetical protein LS482_07495 [Sinomicrobium kalidii]|uniref:hypothetical protein n=1 Tax=Sinomicrobium kalidii TaxID=2900738 RepID=UPI001E583EFC|nr:hypothetical protein [Sinomicrobium kalidii]UGU17712.1 hypothetical protein LS482_07495 [Sinomicrobium kalidii]